MTDQTPEHILPQSSHFVLHQLADGVYAALSTSRGAGGNAGIIDLGGGCLIFDTFMTPAAAEELRQAAEYLTRSPVRYVVNSHWHVDHVLGNSVFPPETLIIATRATRELIAEHIPGQIRALRQQKADMEQELLDLQTRFSGAHQDDQREALKAGIRDLRVMLDALPRYALRLPDWTFEQQLVLHGETRVAEIITFGSGHTPGDAILYLPAENITFVADLLFSGVHPYMQNCQPAEWRLRLEEVAAFNPALVVPGHGPVGTVAALEPMLAGIAAVETCVTDLLARYPEPVMDLSFTDGVPIPPALTGLAHAHRFPRNLAALLQTAWNATPSPKG